MGLSARPPCPSSPGPTNVLCATKGRWALGPPNRSLGSPGPLKSRQPEVIRAIVLLGEHIAPQPEVIRVIVWTVHAVGSRTGQELIGLEVPGAVGVVQLEEHLLNNTGDLPVSRRRESIGTQREAIEKIVGLCSQKDAQVGLLEEGER